MKLSPITATITATVTVTITAAGLAGAGPFAIRALAPVVAALAQLARHRTTGPPAGPAQRAKNLASRGRMAFAVVHVR